MNQKPRAKSCKECDTKFTPMSISQKCCGISCAIAYASKEVKKQVSKDKRVALKQFNDSDRSILLRTAQKVFNTYIRMRDGKKCISCGYEGEGRQFHAGHYMSQGGNSALRFNKLNCHSQCVQCNTYKSGNLANYRIALIDKIGLDKVEYLETTKNIKHWTIDEIKDIINTFKKLTKDLKQH